MVDSAVAETLTSQTSSSLGNNKTSRSAPEACNVIGANVLSNSDNSTHADSDWAAAKIDFKSNVLSMGALGSCRFENGESSNSTYSVAPNVVKSLNQRLRLDTQKAMNANLPGQFQRIKTILCATITMKIKPPIENGTPQQVIPR